MATNVAIVDDRDPLVKYAGAWLEGGASQEFDVTTSFSDTNGSTATFTFVGTSVTVYGTVAAKNLKPQASWSFVVDDSITGTYTPPNNMTSDVHHEALWTSPSSSLANGSHTLVITQSAAASDGVIYLDYILYTTTSDSVGSYFIDDRDPQIKYTPAWRQFGSDPDFQHTSQATTNIGDFLTLQFNGTSILFYGGVTSLTENASIVLDGGAPTFWVPPSTATQTNNLIYKSGPISPGNHTLVVTAENDQPVWADYFLVAPNPPGFVNPSSSSASSASSQSASSTPSPPPASHKKSTPVGAIVGPIIGVLVLVTLLIAIFLWWRRRGRSESSGPLMSTASFSGHGASGGAGPPPVLPHGYSSSLGPIATPSETAGNSGFATYGASGTSDPGSLGFPYGSASNSNLVSTGHRQTPSVSGTAPSLAPNSTSSEDNNLVAIPPRSPPGPTGMIASSKLMREAQRFHVSSPSSSGSVTSSRAEGGQELPPHYSE